jgi:hypothetical protein
LKIKTDLSYTLLGFILYSFYVVGALVSSIEGVSIVFAIVFFTLLVVNHDNIRINYNLFYFVFYINFIIFLSFLLSEYSLYSQYKLFFLLYKFNLLIFIPFFIPLNKVISFIYGIIFALMLAIIIFLFFSVQNFTIFDSNNRLEVGILNPIWISRISLEFLLLILLIVRPKFKTIIFLGSLILIILYASGSKGAIISFLITILFLIFKDSKTSTKILSFFTLSVSFILFLVFLSSFIESDYIKERFFTLIPEGNEQKLLEDNRAVFIPFLINNFFESNLITILFGSGLGNSGFFMFGSNFNIRYYPHNSIVEILLELGLINLIVILYITVKFIISNNSVFVYLLIYFIINSLFSGDFILNEFVFLYAGFALSISNKQLFFKT